MVVSDYQADPFGVSVAEKIALLAGWSCGLLADDRALGYEAACAGTSFATLDQLGSLRYGSPLMHVTGDRTARHGLATIGYDDEGVAARSWDLISGGPQTYVLGGSFNCGKGQPGQVAAVSHGCPAALMRGVRILNTAEEGS